MNKRQSQVTYGNTGYLFSDVRAFKFVCIWAIQCLLFRIGAVEKGLQGDMLGSATGGK